ncbi:hypothetical protein J5X84_35140 [Streptosporangiaceae bacterium NEAU-GS5]|nr:hypothetical protein [Streptosporangiaceae bacterium NEAU-GS5]
MSRRSRRRRVLTNGGWHWSSTFPPPGYGPGEPHYQGPSPEGPLDDPPPGDGGVREPRKPKPSPPTLTEHLPEPDPFYIAADRTTPTPAELTCPAPV